MRCSGAAASTKALLLAVLLISASCGRTDIDSWLDGSAAASAGSAGANNGQAGLGNGRGGSSGMSAGGAGGAMTGGGAGVAGTIDAQWVVYSVAMGAMTESLVAQDVLPQLAQTGVGASVVLSDDALVWPPHFSRDGRFLAFVDGVAGARQHVHLVALSGPEISDVKEVSTESTIEGLAWSQDDARLAWLEKPANQNVPACVQVSNNNGEPVAEFAAARDSQVFWISPKRLAFLNPARVLTLAEWSESGVETKSIAPGPGTRVSLASADGRLALLETLDSNFSVMNFDQRSATPLDAAADGSTSWSASADFNLLATWNSLGTDGSFMRAEQGVPQLPKIPWSAPTMTGLLWAHRLPIALLLNEREATLWRLSEGALHVARGLDGTVVVTEAAFSPDDRRLAIVDGGGQLWLEMVDGSVWPPEPAFVASSVPYDDSLSFTPDTRALLFVSNNNVVNYHPFYERTAKSWTAPSQYASRPEFMVRAQAIAYRAWGGNEPEFIMVQGLSGVSLRVGDCMGLDTALCGPVDFLVQP